MECSEIFCNRSVRAKGLCATHYTRQHLRTEEMSANNAPNPKCSVSHCTLESTTRKEGGLCRPHYQKKYRGIDPESYIVPSDSPYHSKPICQEPGCQKRSVCQDFCEYHHLRARQGKSKIQHNVSVRGTCSFEGCGGTTESQGLCHSHYSQLTTKGELKPLRGWGVYTSSNTCPVPRCRKDQATKGLCIGHARMTREYLLTVEELIEVWTNPVCSNPGCGATKRLHMDHCHETGRFRALLCSPCNTALGFLKENPDRIRGLATYIERF